MKKIVSLALVLILVLGCFGFVACGGDENGTEPVSNGETTTPSNGGTTPTSGNGTTWGDMPVYSGADQVQKGSWAIPPAEGDYSSVEWRYYETGDSLDKVVTFYKSQMPKKGWEEMAWMETPEMSWGMYSKNNEQDAAMVWVGSDEGDIFFALMRASE